MIFNFLLFRKSKQQEMSSNQRNASFMNGNSYDNQDWQTITIRGKPKSSVKFADSAPVAKISPEAAHLRKIDQAEAPQKVKRLSSESKQTMIAKRVANSWNQQQLNQACGFPVNTIRDIENGKITPTPSQLNTLNRVLKTGLKYE